MSWSSGAATDTIQVHQTGDPTVSVFSSNGCYVRSDQVHVEILEQPVAAVLVEGYAELFISPEDGACISLAICDPVSLTAVNIPAGSAAAWTVDDVAVPGLVVQADADGTYALTVTSQNGCFYVTCVNVDLLTSVPLPNITDIQYEFFHEGVSFAEQDTLVACGAVCVQDVVEITWVVNGQSLELTAPYYVVYDLPNGCGSLQNYADLPIYWSQLVNGTGWYPLNMHIVMYVESCTNDSLVFDIADSVFIVSIEPPEIMPTDTAFICIGDTAILVLHCGNCEQVEWSGPGLLSVSADGDSAWANAFGLYTVIASNSDLGVECQAAAYFQVAIAQPPQLIIEPPGGLVCPGQSVLIHTSFISSIYEWVGPSGPLSTNNDSISVTDVGAYFLTTYTASGCPLFNGPVNLQHYATPVLQFVPDAILCPGETAILQVQGGFIEQLNWAPPLSGGSLSQYISTPGTYACTVTSCGIEQELSATLIGDTISVAVPVGPYSLCPGGSVVVDGPTTPYQYLWVPGNTGTEDLVVTMPGDYQLLVTDSLGCTAASNIITVSLATFTLPLIVQGDVVCPGEDAVLVASGSGTIVWYADAALQQQVTEGDSLMFTAPEASDTLYVTQTENGCTGPPSLVILNVVGQPPAPVITGDTTLCVGDDLQLMAQQQPNVSYIWDTPTGPLSGPVIIIGSITGQNAGVYTCMAAISGCPGSQSTVVVSVSTGPVAPVISGPTTICVGDELLLSVAEVPGISYSWNTPQGPLSGNVVNVVQAGPGDAGVYVCTPLDGECPGVPSQTSITMQTPPLVPVVAGPSALCEGDEAVLTVTSVNGPFTWILSRRFISGYGWNHPAYRSHGGQFRQLWGGGGWRGMR